MAKLSLKDTVHEREIVISNEVRNTPNFIIDEDYGIVGKYLDYALVRRKVAHRRGKEEDGENNGKVIRYTNWEELSYSSTIEGALLSYARRKELEDFTMLSQCTDINKLTEIRSNIESNINKVLKMDTVSNLLEKED